MSISLYYNFSGVLLPLSAMWNDVKYRSAIPKTEWCSSFTADMVGSITFWIIIKLWAKERFRISRDMLHMHIFTLLTNRNQTVAPTLNHFLKVLASFLWPLLGRCCTRAITYCQHLVAVCSKYPVCSCDRHHKNPQPPLPGNWGSAGGVRLTPLSQCAEGSCKVCILVFSYWVRTYTCHQNVST